jgi:glycerate kinase
MDGRAPAGWEDADVHVLIAPEDLPGRLTSAQVAVAVAEGWHRTAPGDTVEPLPLSAGGPGFVEAVAATLGGTSHAVVTTDPLGREVPGSVLLVPTDAGPAAYVEAAQACGLHLLAPGERDPRHTTSFGVGALLVAALDLGATRVVVGVGGAGTNDAGAGLLAALGVGPRERLGRGGLALAGATGADLAGLEAARARFRGIELFAATDVAAPLLGLKGSSAVLAPRMGATDADAQRLENAVGHFASVVARAHPPVTDLLSGEPIRPERTPGAGAGGGLGYALELLGGRCVPGTGTVLDLFDLDQRIARSDLVVTFTRSYDWESLQDTVVDEVATRVQAHGVPTVLLTGRSVVSRREAMNAGLNGVYAVAERGDDVDDWEADPSGRLADLAARVARTWSPRF